MSQCKSLTSCYHQTHQGCWRRAPDEREPRTEIRRPTRNVADPYVKNGQQGLGQEPGLTWVSDGFQMGFRWVSENLADGFAMGFRWVSDGFQMP